MTGQIKISIVIPTKNEEKTIGELINKVRKYGDEILVVDGHSSDKTRDVANQNNVRVILDNGLGKGDGLRLAIKKVSGDIIVFIDADGSHDPNDIPNLLKPILDQKAELVMGSRIKGGSDELHGTFSELSRLWGGRIIAAVINLRFNQNLTDYLNGFRAIKTETARKLDLKEKQHSIEHEMAIECLKNGFRIIEIPTHEYRRKYGESNISLIKQGPRFVYVLFKKIIF